MDRNTALVLAPANRRWTMLLATVTLLLGPGSATALSFDLEVEFDTGQVGTYAVVDVVESGGDLVFDIRLAPSLGDDADLHEVYFNLLGSLTGVTLSTTDTPSRPYRLRVGGPTRGGTGARFEYAINFGNGAGRHGNGRLREANFTLSADQPLSLLNLQQTTMAGGGSIEISFAAHIQGTDLFRGTNSETVGGLVPVPEPGTAPLLSLGLGLVGLARVGRRRSSG